MVNSCLSRRFVRKAGHVGSSVIFMSRRMKSKVGCNDPRTMCKQTKFPCGHVPELQLQRKITKPSGKKGKEPFVSMWETAPCDKVTGVCPVNQRFDDLYYCESDKKKRCYAQTWASCPKLEIKPVVICPGEEDPPIQRRYPPEKRGMAKTACPVTETACPQIPRKCSRKARVPGKCPAFLRYPSDCTKPLTPYPSFSECKRLSLGELPLSECLCWRKPMMCEMWAEYRRRFKASNK